MSPIFDRTITDEAVQERAKLALEILMATEDDSFAPTNAVRALPDYDTLSPADRASINRALTNLITG